MGKTLDSNVMYIVHNLEPTLHFTPWGDIRIDYVCEYIKGKMHILCYISFYHAHVVLFAWKQVQQSYAVNGPQHEKSNKMRCAPSEESDQLEHLSSLISLCCALNGKLRA